MNGGIKIKRTNLKKIFIIGAITLFLILAVSPAIQAENTNNSINDKEKLYEIEIEEFKADGTTEKNIIQLTNKELNELKNELLSTRSVDDQLLILKKYNLIPEDKSINDLENGMREKAFNLGIDTNQKSTIFRFRQPILLQFFKKVTATYIGGISTNFGFKFITNIINRILDLNLPTFDFADFTGGLFGVVTTEGLLLKNSHTLITFPGFSGMIGFVGYRTNFPLLLHTYTGYSAITFGLGFGMHIKN